MNSPSNELHKKRYDHDHEIFYDEYAIKLNQQVNISGINLHLTVICHQNYY